MKIKTADLLGPALDWAVAKCEGETLSQAALSFQIKEHGCLQRPHLGNWKPSVSWPQGGPIIEWEGINLFKHNKLNESQPDVWCAHKVVPRPNMEGSFNSCALALDGPTPLIAAMRCVVAANLGDEVDVPDELV